MVWCRSPPQYQHCSAALLKASIWFLSTFLPSPDWFSVCVWVFVSKEAQCHPVLSTVRGRGRAGKLRYLELSRETVWNTNTHTHTYHSNSQSGQEEACVIITQATDDYHITREDDHVHRNIKMYIHVMWATKLFYRVALDHANLSVTTRQWFWFPENC